MITIRQTVVEDAAPLKQWLMEPGVLRWFPMLDEREVDDSVRIWVSYAKHGACLTADYNNEPCGMANLYIQPYKKLSHQCLFAILVSEKQRNKGVGTQLLAELIRLAKESFQIETLHLEVYKGNPAIHLYQRAGFKVYGEQPRFIKEQGEYITKIMMQKQL